MGKGRGAADTMEGFAGDGPRSNHMGHGPRHLGLVENKLYILLPRQVTCCT